MTLPALWFDAAFYQAQLPAPVASPLDHFRRHGDAAGLAPSPYFDTRFYKARYPDWAAKGASTAVESFLAAQARGHWQAPHPMILPKDYLARYPDVAAAKVSPALHFAQHGDREGRSPGAGFDAAFYARCYLQLAETHAFRHYITTGRTAGLLPRPQPRDAATSATTVACALQTLPRPIILAVHDAQEAGTPILVRDLARWLAGRGHNPLFLLLNGGPLLPQFRALGPCFLLAEGWDAAGLFHGIPEAVPVMAHSGVAASLAQQAAATGHHALLLIHEMRGYLDAQGLIPHLAAAQSAGARLVVSFPRMADELQPDLGPLSVLHPGILTPQTPLHAFRQRKQLAGGHSYISAGHADHRKGFDLFLDAARDIHAHDPTARFIWLGALDPWARSLAEAALHDGLPLHLPGFVTDYPAWYAAASVYLLTSRQDPGPTTLIHAAAMGTAFAGYASDIGLRQAAAPLGTFVPEGDRPALVAAALAAARVSRDPAARRQRRAYVRQHASFDAYASALLSRLSL